MMEKHQLRKTLLAMRRAMPPDEKAWRDKAIAERLAAWLEENPAASIGLYWPTQGEPDLTGVYSLLADRGIRLALPVVVGRDAPLAFHPWRPGDALAADAHGVMAPAQRGAPVRPELLAIPCVGFNAQGYRLGYGGGYYDRTLAVEAPPRTVGIAYAACEAVFAANAHDVMMGTIITER
ncbi:5-formyltetrahydrofolate cyclo-ligase [Noviherbaspirillum suwonense]|uniref:5-formyltetrahydrofolate cyclo-ligase n=2 Tax=Noviherbaspirillum suwonense TaxID=1224511 RepID=A0ABY1PY92_9BURK|nr:5-formyltetrahydrofolate cyclo-ligase [Noviherbaspirillum suwonense]